MRVQLPNPAADPVLVNAVKKYAVAWEPFANIKFAFFEEEIVADPDITIRFVDLPDGSSTMRDVGWGYRMDIEQSQFINGAITEAEFGRVTIHEFGHALGAEHEHQRPGVGIAWNRAAVKQAFVDKPRRTRSAACEDPEIGAAMIEMLGPDNLIVGDIFNINTLAEAPAAHMSAYDRHSIMHYPIPHGYTENIPEILIPENMCLSKIDKAWIARYYPHTQRQIMPVWYGSLPNTPCGVEYPRPALGAGTPRRPGGLVSLNADVDLANIDADADVVARVDVMVTPADDRRFEVGSFEAELTEENSVVSAIAFDRPFLEPDPVVIVWLDSIHIVNDTPTRIKAYASHITPEGFTIHLDRTGDSGVQSAGASWVAYPKDTPGVQAGNIAPAGVARNGPVQFIDESFNQNSNVLIAVNQLDFAAANIVKFEVSSNVNQHGMDIQVCSHVGATYLALAPTQAPIV